ncbi:MAG: 2-dehydropantoate 2-reductase [Bariatricus sp.]
MMNEIREVAIIGMGAMGSGYAMQILGHNREVQVYGVVRDLQRYQKNPILVNGEAPAVEYISFPIQLHPMDLIIIAVKSYNLPDVISHMAPMVGETTQIISLLNGLTSEEKLIQAFGEEHVLYATVTGADANRKDNLVNFNRCGCLYFGERKNNNITERVRKLADFWNASGIEYQIPEDMDYKLWDKFMVNIGCNQTSTAFQMNYEQLRNSPKAMDIMRKAQREVIKLANYYGVPLSESNIIAWERDLSGLTSEGHSSMLQDYWQGRPLEMDILGDTVLEFSRKSGIPVPTNKMLRDKIYFMVQERNTVSRGYAATPDKIATQLRLDILRQKIKKGDKIAENQLAQRFSASRSSVRTALQILSNEGLIITHSNGRREAVEFKEKQVLELYNFRWLIEQEALRIMLAQRSSMFPLIARVLDKIEATCAVHGSSNDCSVDWYDLDVEFHRAQVRSSGNMFLINAWESNAQLIYTLMSFNTSAGYGEEYASTFFEKHRRLYEMWLSGDSNSFQELEKHIMDAEVVSKSVLEMISM